MNIQKEIKTKGECHVKGIGKFRVGKYIHPKLQKGSGSNKFRKTELVKIYFKPDNELKECAREFFHK